MSNRDWERFVRTSGSKTLKRFGKHVTSLVDVARNEQSMTLAPDGYADLSDHEKIQILKRLVQGR